VLDEFKTHLRGGQVVLRSKTPQLVEQEFYGMMLAHRAVRTLMNEAAQYQHLDPGRLSLNLIPRRLAMPARPVGYPDVQQKSRNPEWKDAVKSVRNRMGFAIDEQKSMHAKRKCEQSQYPTGD
jgi:hypothetical protein